METYLIGSEIKSLNQGPMYSLIEPLVLKSWQKIAYIELLL